MDKIRFFLIIIEKIKFFLLEFLDMLLHGLKIKTNNTSKKQIVFVLDKPQAIIFRLSKWIKRYDDNFELILLSNTKDFIFDTNVDGFDHFFAFRNKWHLIRIIKSLKNIYLIHSFTAPSKHSYFLIKKIKDIPILSDWKDVVLNYYGFHPPFKYLKKDLNKEKFSFAHSDGVICRSLEPLTAYRRYDIKNKPPKLFFLEYCDNDLFENNKKNIDINNLHLVYIGGVGALRNSTPFNLKPVVDIICKQKIHLHFYISQAVGDAIVSDYSQIAQNNPYFHCHKAVNSSELAKELSQYDFGIQPFFTSSTEHLKYKRIGSTSMKLFNYLEAGLPIIIAKGPEFQNYKVKRYGVGFSVESKKELENLKEKISSINYEKLSNNVVNVREKFSMKTNIHRLIDFYKYFWEKGTPNEKNRYNG